MDIDWLAYLGIGSVLLLSGLLAAAAIQARRLRRTIADLRGVQAALERDMQALCQGARGMGDAVQGLERKLRRVTQRQDQIELREPDTRTYRQAIGLVRKGAGAGHLVSTCGLSRNEAELVYLMHHQEKAAHRSMPGA